MPPSEPDHSDQWYSHAARYWESDVPSSVDGMLGGYGKISNVDVKGSKSFISEYVNGVKGSGGKLTKEPRVGRDLACDCGAGIGRVSKNFLLDYFSRVDLVEQSPKFLEESKRFMSKEYAEGRVDRAICTGLQDFVPDSGRYDVIWCQWVLGHLTDDDLIALLKRCKVGLKPNGVICIKENISVADVILDKEDNSVTRPSSLYYEIFERAGLSIVKEVEQHGFPDELFMVKMFALA